MIGWNSFTTGTKIRTARVLYQVVSRLRDVAGRPRRIVAHGRGVNFDLDLAEGSDLAMYLFGIFEVDTYRALRRLVRPGDTVLDIGANSGVHTLPLAKLVGEAGRVIAFEPTDLAFRRLLRNLELNPELASRVTPVMAYLDDGQRTDPPASFYASWRLDRPGEHPKHFGSRAQAPRAAAWTLDEYASAAGLPRVDVIKLDVDGYECKVLRGADSLLERQRPAIVAEVCPYALEEHGDSAAEMLGLLLKHGYSFYDERTLRRVSNEPAAIEASIKPNSSINLIALGAGHSDERHS